MKVTRVTNRAEQLLVYFILFYAGVVYCLPVPHSEEVAALYPWWAKRVDFASIMLNEVVFLVWAIFFGSAYLVKSCLNRGVPTRDSALAILTLSVWCGIISIGAPLVFQDIGRTFRLLLISCLLLAIVKWAMTWRIGVLTSYLTGILLGTLINLTISFMHPLVVYETMRLSGQNTPGVAMGVAIHLCAWLFYGNDNVKIRLFSIATTLILVFSCALSYSRIGWFAGATGILAWCFVLFFAKPYINESGKRYPLFERRKFAISIALTVFMFSLSPMAREGVGYLGVLIEQKQSRQDESNAHRFSYLIGAIEIIGKNPFGVGYSGFYHAQTSTDVYKRGEAAEEDDPESANPHASFLWYLVAGGVPAGLLSIYAFIALQRNMLIGFRRDMGRSGVILFALALPSYVLIGLTVPYIFNSLIMVAPIAIIAGWGLHRKLTVTSLRFSR
jgi:hypothetical protein